MTLLGVLAALLFPGLQEFEERRLATVPESVRAKIGRELWWKAIKVE